MSRMLRQYLEAQADQVETVLVAHRLPGRITGGTVGPRLIRFTLDPAPQTSISSVRGIAEDLAISLKVPSLRIDRTKEGIILEFPNPEPRPVTFAGLWPEVKPLPPTTALLGLTDDGAPLLAHLSSPEVNHVLVTGDAGAGKSALLRTIALSLALPNVQGLKLMCLDPTGRGTFRGLESAPQLSRPPITGKSEAVEALRSLYRLMTHPETGRHTVALIDDIELALPGARQGEVEHMITSLVNPRDDTGIHLVVATEDPSSSDMSTLIRANFPLRLVGRITSPDDSNLATGVGQTETNSLPHSLGGRGDFLAVTPNSPPIRFQTAYINPSDVPSLIITSQEK